jgi:hypothetical protein
MTQILKGKIMERNVMYLQTLRCMHILGSIFQERNGPFFLECGNEDIILLYTFM